MLRRLLIALSVLVLVVGVVLIGSAFRSSRMEIPAGTRGRIGPLTIGVANVMRSSYRDVKGREQEGPVALVAVVDSRTRTPTQYFDVYEGASFVVAEYNFSVEKITEGDEKRESVLLVVEKKVN